MPGTKRCAPSSEDADAIRHAPEEACDKSRNDSNTNEPSNTEKSHPEKRQKTRRAASPEIADGLSSTKPIQDNSRTFSPKLSGHQKRVEIEGPREVFSKDQISSNDNRSEIHEHIGSQYSAQSPYPNDRYTVAWICALSTEYVAAQEFLDEEHGIPRAVDTHDNNIYTLGRVRDHNVVIAILPDGDDGTSAAASVARDMMHSFPNIRIGLMVGVANGAPTERHDIRRGDIVVSAACNGMGGVYQLDFGKRIQGKGIQPTGFLNQPPILLRNAVNALRADIERRGHCFEQTIHGILSRNQKLPRKYQRPQPGTDKLFRRSVLHGPCCVPSCSDDSSLLIPRAERKEEDDNPAIHYGLICSGNQSVEDATLRDTLSTSFNILCFKSGAAGIMNHFPCLVICGICDYADTHRNKAWQGYASMTAAAYAKSLLYRIPLTRGERGLIESSSPGKRH